MKKLSFFLLAALIFSTAKVFSQSPLPIGKAQFNAGIGLSEWGVPIYFGLDYSVHEDITVGGEFSYRSYREHWNNGYYRHNVIGISGNGNYHFNTLLDIPQEWDFYAGLNLGFYIWNSPNDYYGSRSTGVGLGLQIGGRYYFSDKFGINLEFGGGNAFSGGKFGVSIKL